MLPLSDLFKPKKPDIEAMTKKRILQDSSGHCDPRILMYIQGRQKPLGHSVLKQGIS
jgi:hypothetical protein